MKIKNIICLIIILITGFLAYYFYTTKDTLYSIISLSVLILTLIIFIKGLFDIKDPYQAELNKIIKTYDSLLIEVEALPKVTGKKVVRTKYFKDLVNVQFELRKPIYYLQDPLFCEFLVTDNTQAYVFTLKRDEEYISKSEEIVEGKVDEKAIEKAEELNKEEENKFLLNEEDRKDMIYNMIENDEEKKEAINDMIENNTTENDDLSKRMEEFKRKMHIN